MSAVDAEHVALAGPPQRRLDLAHAVDAVGRHPGERHLGRDRPLDHRQRKAGLGREADLGRHMGRRQAGRIVGPGLGQVQRPVDEGVAVPGHVGREDPDLAVGDLAGRARVLARDAAGRLALLEEAGLVEHQHGILVGQRLQRVVAHHVAQRVGLPAAAAEDGLLPPGAGVARRLRPHPARLAPLGAEQAVQEQPRRDRHPLLAEQRPDPPLHLPQRARPTAPAHPRPQHPPRLISEPCRRSRAEIVAERNCSASVTGRWASSPPSDHPVAGLMLPSVVGIRAATSCGQKGAGGPI